jgi:hypothetical protein
MSAKRQEIEEAIKKLAQALASPDVEVVGVRTNLGRYRIPGGPMRDALNRSINRLATGRHEYGISRTRAMDENGRLHLLGTLCRDNEQPAEAPLVAVAGWRGDA